MKKIFLLLLFIATVLSLNAQEYEWNVENTYINPGERIVAVFDAGEVGTWDGIELVGQVIDNNGNWGYNLPTVADFTLYVRFSSGISYKLEQSVQTSNIVLRLRKISDSKFHLTANCPKMHKGMRVLFKKTEGSVTVSIGNPTTIDTSGDLVIANPTYQSYVSGKFGIGTSNPRSSLHIQSSSVNIASTASHDANMIIQGTSNGRNINEGTALGFVIPANTNGGNP